MPAASILAYGIRYMPSASRVNLKYRWPYVIHSLPMRVSVPTSICPESPEKPHIHKRRNKYCLTAISHRVQKLQKAFKVKDL
jgi:hypothetical protein